MILLKSEREIEIMREAGRLTALALREAGRAVEPGVTTLELDGICRRVIKEGGGICSCLGYNGYPAAACISVNDVVIHGIPSGKKLLSGDIVSIDICAGIGGFHGDSAKTFACGDISENARRLIEATERSFREGLAQVKAGGRIGDVAHAVQQYAEGCGYSVVREFTGHGIGASLHEDPGVPNYGAPGRGARMSPGMTFTIEPMINEGDRAIRILDDGWTVVTKDHKLAAHYEHTLAVTENGYELLTELDDRH
jgi:methionyl aminopeptidase